jgi:hypothetical protein
MRIQITDFFIILQILKAVSPQASVRRNVHTGAGYHLRYHGE